MTDPNKLTIIGLDTEDGPEHDLYDERIKLKLKKSFLDSIKHYGVVEPIIVKKGVVVDGRQRVRAAREAGVDVPTCEYEGDGLTAVTLNEIRQDDDMLTRAEKAARYLEVYEPKDVARAFGVSQKQVKNYAKIADLCAAVKAAVKAGRISATAASNLHGLEPKDQEAKLKELLRSPGKATVRKAKQKKNGKPQAVGKRQLNRLHTCISVLQYGEEGKRVDEKTAELFKGVEVPPDFWDGVSWVLGKLGTKDALDDSEVPGIKALLRKLG